MFSIILGYTPVLDVKNYKQNASFSPLEIEIIRFVNMFISKRLVIKSSYKILTAYMKVKREFGEFVELVRASSLNSVETTSLRFSEDALRSILSELSQKYQCIGPISAETLTEDFVRQDTVELSYCPFRVLLEPPFRDLLPILLRKMESAFADESISSAQ